VKILSLDCATACGWATNALGGVESGVELFLNPRGASSGWRFLKFRQWLTDLLDRTQPEVVLYEQPLIGPMRSSTVAEVAFGMVTRVEELCTERGIEYRPVHNALLKRYATGKGNADKVAMIVAAQERFGKQNLEHDEAEALMLLAWGLDGFPEPEATKPKNGRSGAGGAKTRAARLNASESPPRPPSVDATAPPVVAAGGGKGGRR
jgi:crossover junction endodeoxyribonuclease RuvC